MRLYEINDILVNAIQDGDRFISEEGEVFTVEEFEQLALDRDEKIENLLLYVKNLKAEAQAIKAEREALEKREKTALRKAEGISEFLKGLLQETKFSTPRVQVSYRHTKAVVADVSLLPDEFVRVTEKRDADKTAIKEAILRGETVNGAVLEERTSMVIK